MRALPVAKNGLPSMIGISLSSSMFKIIKSGENMNLSTLISTSSIIPLGYLKDQSTSCKVTIVGLASPKPSFLKMERGIKLMLAPRSQNALSNTTFPIEHGIMKLPISLSFGGTFFYNMALHSSESAIVLYSPMTLKYYIDGRFIK